MIYKINFFVKMFAQKFSNRSFIHFIVAYTDIWEIYIFTIREQHVKSFMPRSLPVENLLPENVGSIINYFQ